MCRVMTKEGGSAALHCHDMELQPVENILVDSIAVDLIEHLMPSAGVELHAQIPGPGLLEKAVHLLDTPAVGAHRVPIS